VRFVPLPHLGNGDSPGAVNPADLPSRGLEAQKLQNCTVWWEGPPFIKFCKEAWPNPVDPPPSDTTMAELMKTSVQDNHVLASGQLNQCD